MKELHINTSLILLFIIQTLFSLNLAFSQKISQEETNKSFDSAVALLNDGKFEASLDSFSNFLTKYKFNSKTTAAEFFKIKIHLELKQLNQFKFAADQFLELYPNSKYVDEIRLLLTKYYLEIANNYNAFREILFIIEKTNSSLYEQKAKKIGEGIAAKYLNDIQLQKSYLSFSSVKVKPYVLLQEGKYFLRNGDNFNAENTFAELIRSYPESDEYDEAKKLTTYSYTPVSANTIIGVMLPLETNSAGEYSSQSAIEILEGIKFAVDEFNKLRSDKVGLLIRDTKKDVDEIKSIKDEFISLNSLVAILGPIYSNEVRATLQEFDDCDIPIISPTATDDDLTSISRNFFQANPSFSVRGRLMAQYLFYSENRRVVSVMNSIDGYSPILAASFISEFEELGGRVVKRESYKNDFTDFSDPVSKIYSDSLVIQGIYIPLSDNSVTPLIFSELIKFGIKIPLYGNQDWFTAKGYETASQVSNNLTFTSDYFADFNSEVFKNFNDQFVAIIGKDVNRNVLYGYDTAKFLLTAIRNSEPGRKNLVDKMISGMISSGLHNNISFDARRINKYLNIVRYNTGVFELVDKFRLGQ
jgi:branched-chain amino acid transport system substrate-binding protein